MGNSFRRNKDEGASDSNPEIPGQGRGLLSAPDFSRKGTLALDAMGLSLPGDMLPLATCHLFPCEMTRLGKQQLWAQLKTSPKAKYKNWSQETVSKWCPELQEGE